MLNWREFASLCSDTLLRRNTREKFHDFGGKMKHQTHVAAREKCACSITFLEWMDAFACMWSEAQHLWAVLPGQERALRNRHLVAQEMRLAAVDHPDDHVVIQVSGWWPCGNAFSWERGGGLGQSREMVYNACLCWYLGRSSETCMHMYVFVYVWMLVQGSKSPQAYLRQEVLFTTPTHLAWYKYMHVDSGRVHLCRQNMCLQACKNWRNIHAACIRHLNWCVCQLHKSIYGRCTWRNSLPVCLYLESWEPEDSTTHSNIFSFPAYAWHTCLVKGLCMHVHLHVGLLYVYVVVYRFTQ
jgi:hypothetical protein